MYRLVVFGKPMCSACREAKSVLPSAAEKAGAEFDYVDLDTPEGLALGLYYDVTDLVPVILLVQGGAGEPGRPVKRWDSVPDGREVLDAVFEAGQADSKQQ